MCQPADQSPVQRAHQCNRGRISKLAVSLIALVFLSQQTTAAPVKEIKRVLVIYEAGLSYPGLASADRAIRETLNASTYQIELYTENLEEILFADEASQREFRQEYIRKYRDRKPDLIIAEGPPSIQFIAESHEKFFPDVPVVLCCNIPGKPQIDSNSTGVWMTLEPAKTLDVALQLLPRTKEVVVVGGISAFDRQVEAIVREQTRNYERRIKFTYLTDLKEHDLFETIQRLPIDTVILYTAFSQDADGNTYIDTTQLLPALASAANAPVFALFEPHVGHGPVGGDVFSYAAQGRVAAEMALRILKGVRPKDIPVARLTNLYVFDWSALRRWGLDERHLPSGTIALNREPTLWERYWKYIVAAVALVLIQTLLIVGLLWNRARRRMIEKSLIQKLTFESLLSDLSTDFINLSDEHVERNVEKGLRRIAEFLDIDRITLYEFSPDKTELTATFWCSDGVDLPPRVLKISEVRWWTHRVLSGEATLFSDLNDLPEEAAAEKEYFRGRGIASAASIPLKVAGEIIGAISFVSTNRRVIWSNDLVMQLGVMAEVFANMLRRRQTVSELKRAEAVLRESEERFRLVANQAPVLIWMSAPDKLCTYFNQPWLNFTGRSIEAEVGNGWADGVHPEDLETCLATYSEFFDARRRFRMEYRLRRFDGQYRWIEDIGIPRFNADGSFAGYIGSCTDTTDRKLLEMQLLELSGHLIKAQEEERSRIARELHDDLSQRLALLGIEIQTLQNNPPKPKALFDKLEALFQRVTEVCEDVHQLSHRLHPSVLDRLGLVPAVKGLCREIQEQSGIKFAVNCRDVPDCIPKDVSVCLFRVLQEAMGNVVKHSGAKEANVELAGSCDRIHLRVADSGSGFGQSSNGHSGIGLLSMRERVRLVGGELVIQSGIPHGTIVEADIPLPSAELSDDTMAATA